MYNTKTRILISNALFSLMREKPYNKISVRDISGRTYMSRATFYNHFKSRDEVLAFLLERAFGVVADYTREPQRDEFGGYMRALSSAIISSMDLLRLLESQGILSAATEYIEASRQLGETGSRDALLPLIYETRAGFYTAYGIKDRHPTLSARELEDFLVNPPSPYELSVAATDCPGRECKSVRALFNVAGELLCEATSSQITVAALASRAGVARSTFYRHFESVEKLLVAMLEQCFLRALTSGGSLREILERCESFRPLLTELSSDRADMYAARMFFRVYKRLAGHVPDNLPAGEALREHCRRWQISAAHTQALLLYFAPGQSLGADDFAEGLTGLAGSP